MGKSVLILAIQMQDINFVSSVQATSQGGRELRNDCFSCQTHCYFYL